MSITWADVVAIAPDLAAVAPAGQAAILASVPLFLDSATLGTRYDLASTYLCAHLGVLVLRGGDGAGGPLSSEGVGPLSAGYAVPPIEDPIYDTTPWGRMLRGVISLLPASLGQVS